MTKTIAIAAACVIAALIWTQIPLHRSGSGETSAEVETVRPAGPAYGSLSGPARPDPYAGMLDADRSAAAPEPEPAAVRNLTASPAAP